MTVNQNCLSVSNIKSPANVRRFRRYQKYVFFCSSYLLIFMQSKSIIYTEIMRAYIRKLNGKSIFYVRLEENISNNFWLHISQLLWFYIFTLNTAIHYTYLGKWKGGFYNVVHNLVSFFVWTGCKRLQKVSRKVLSAMSLFRIRKLEVRKLRDSVF